MRRLNIFLITATIGLALCGCASKSDIYNEGYNAGYSEGYFQGRFDAMSKYESSIMSEESMEDTDNDYVYVSGIPTTYHRPGCRYLEGRGNILKLSIEEAESFGLGPCEECNP